MSCCVVTGGAGFIGSHLVEGLLLQGHTVRIIDNFATGKRRNVQAVQDQLAVEGITYSLEMCEGSILEAPVLANVMAGVDYVFHQAALASVAFSLQNPLLSNRVNVEGTLNVLLAARDAGVKRVIYAGSSSAYGDLPELPKREDHPARPLSPYALAKFTGEQYCGMFTRLYGLETVVLRYFNVFGARQDPHSQYAAVIPKFITACLEQEPVRIFGDGLQSRDFTYVDNVVHGNILAMTAAEAAGQVINLANGGRTTLLQLVGYLERIFGRHIPREFFPPQPGDVKHSQADASRAKALLGFQPLIEIEQGLERAVAYYRHQYEALGKHAGEV